MAGALFIIKTLLLALGFLSTESGGGHCADERAGVRKIAFYGGVV